MIALNHSLHCADCIVRFLFLNFWDICLFSLTSGSSQITIYIKFCQQNLTRKVHNFLYFPLSFLRKTLNCLSHLILNSITSPLNLIFVHKVVVFGAPHTSSGHGKRQMWEECVCFLVFYIFLVIKVELICRKVGNFLQYRLVNRYSKHDDILILKYDLIFCFLSPPRLARRHLNLRWEKQLNVTQLSSALGDIIFESKLLTAGCWNKQFECSNIWIIGTTKTKLHNIFLF